MIIADSSLVANLLIPLLDQSAAEQVLQKDEEWKAPSLWRYEFGNTLLKYIRKELMPLEPAQGLMEQAIRSMGLPLDDSDDGEVISTAIELKISAYDAQYVVLARQWSVPLVTFDQKLVKAAKGIAISPADFVG